MIKLVKIAAGPFSLVFAWWFNAIVVPQLEPALRSAIDDGFLGAVIGFFGVATVFLCCTLSWRELKTLWRHPSHSANS